MALAASLESVLEDPRDVLDRLPYETTPSFSPLLILFSATLSLAIADVWMVPSTLSVFPWTFLLYAIDALAWVILFSRLSRLWKVPKIRFRSWWRAGVLAIAPLHLALPAALLFHPFGTVGYALYGFFKLLLLGSILRRWVWAIEIFNQWPPWASALMVASPFILVLCILMIGALVGMAAAAIAVLGVLK